jgi:hypothetical protein
MDANAGSRKEALSPVKRWPKPAYLPNATNSHTRA